MRIELNKKLAEANGELNLVLNFEIKEGSFTTLNGESGAGKTSLLRMIAGFLEPDAGEIKISNSTWYSSSQRINLKPQKRRVGFVFQDYALFPNMTVRENLEFAVADSAEKKIVSELIEVAGLGELQSRKPTTLSGGQKQRVALARAICMRPSLLLLDEPLSALDKKMRSELQDYILQVHKKFELTTIMVSHDVGEAFKLSDEILLLQNGTIVRRGSPSEFYSSHEVSGKFKFTGEVIAINKSDVVYIVSIIIGNNLVKVVADESEVGELKIGDEVLVASKAFNPMIQKIKQR